MHDCLVKAQQDLDIALPSIEQASIASLKALGDMRTKALEYLTSKGIAQAEDDPELGLVAFGSLARHEASETESDFDYAVLAYKAVGNPENIQHYRRAAEVGRRQTQLNQPGASRIFGGLISSADLVNRIGLDDDTNRTHTQRMLFLEESVPIVGDEAHQQTMAAILRRYLADYQDPLQKVGVPRFLLNDVDRYWRTIAVDYQAKRWDELSFFGEIDPEGNEKNPKWGTRYLKLRSSRKLAFCGSLVALFVPRLDNVEVTSDLLMEQFSMPALARIAQLTKYVDDADDRRRLAEILLLADWFASKFADSDFREQVDQVEHPRALDNNPTFIEAREKSQALQERLEWLFLSKKTLNVPDESPLEGCTGGLSLRQLAGRYLLF